jgi:hypothetical protein
MMEKTRKRQKNLYLCLLIYLLQPHTTLSFRILQNKTNRNLYNPGSKLYEGGKGNATLSIYAY